VQAQQHEREEREQRAREEQACEERQWQQREQEERADTLKKAEEDVAAAEAVAKQGATPLSLYI
jgi:hypothetical protein